MLAPPELKKIHPLGKSPIITDGDTTIAESSVIINYILTKYGDGKMRPKENTPEYWDYEYWMAYPESNLMRAIVDKLIFSIIPKRAPFFMRPIVGPVFSSATEKIIDPEIRVSIYIYI